MNRARHMLKVLQTMPPLYAVLFLVAAVLTNDAQHAVLAWALPSSGDAVGMASDVLHLVRVLVLVAGSPFFAVTRITAAALAFI